MSVADTVVVMDHGRIEQVGPPRTIYNAPATSFVARFIGGHNTLPLKIFGMTTTATTPVLYAPGTVTTGVSFLVTMLCLFFTSLFTIDRQRASSHCQGWSTSVQLSGNSTEDLLYGLRSVGLPIQGFGDIQEQYSQFVDDGLLALHLAPHGRMGARCDCISQNPEFGLTHRRHCLEGRDTRRDGLDTPRRLRGVRSARFPHTRKNSSPAAARLRLVMSVSGGSARKVKVTGERANGHRTSRFHHSDGHCPGLFDEPEIEGQQGLASCGGAEM